ncbi:MAG: DsbA family protein [Euryarchaeota archaeon]|nr:DsbA family protein [Euryarchaeota archaeon]
MTHPSTPSLLLLLLLGAVVLSGCVSEGQERNEDLDAFQVEGDPYLGNREAEVVVVAFESPLCSGCKHFHESILPDLTERYFTPDGSVVFYFKQFDTYGRTGHAADERALQIALECTARTSNDGFWALTHVLYADQFKVGEDNIREVMESVADDAGFDGEAVFACYDAAGSEPDVEADIQVARDLGIRGTPSFFVIGPTGPATRTNDLVQTIEDKLDDVDTTA